eukprot:COSAG02_NODE_3501_length_6648_cov_3.862269_1_plen_133_part_00
MLRGFNVASDGVPAGGDIIDVGTEAVIASAVVAAADAAGSPALMFLTLSTDSVLEVMSVRSPSGSVAWRAPLTDAVAAPTRTTAAGGNAEQRLVVAEVSFNDGGSDAMQPVVVVSTEHGVVGLADPAASDRE